MAGDEYRCLQCGHGFGHIPGVRENDLRCPRCGSASLEASRYLFGKASTEGLVDDDFFDAALAPCCNLRYVGRHPSSVAPECETERCDRKGQDDETEGKRQEGRAG